MKHSDNSCISITSINCAMHSWKRHPAHTLNTVRVGELVRKCCILHSTVLSFSPLLVSRMNWETSCDIKMFGTFQFLMVLLFVGHGSLGEGVCYQKTNTSKMCALSAAPKERRGIMALKELNHFLFCIASQGYVTSRGIKKKKKRNQVKMQHFEHC